MVSSGYHRRHYNPSLSVTSSSFSKLTNFETLSVPPPPPQPHHNLIQNPSSSGNADSQNPDSAVAAVAPPLEDVYLSNSSHLTRLEVVRRRAHNVRQLTMVYRDHYWAMMEELKAKYKEYVWKYGSSPYKEDDSEMGNISKDERGLEVDPTLCVFYGCTLKAMALTKFCHLHILSDSKQVLYKPCEYVIKSAQAGPITCGRPILRARVPVFCNVHLQKAHRALKKAGLHVSSSSKLAPKFHLIVAEYVRQIQAKRRAALGGNINNVVVKREGCN